MLSSNAPKGLFHDVDLVGALLCRDESGEVWISRRKSRADCRCPANLVCPMEGARAGAGIVAQGSVRRANRWEFVSTVPTDTNLTSNRFRRDAGEYARSAAPRSSSPHRAPAEVPKRNGQQGEHRRRPKPNKRSRCRPILASSRCPSRAKSHNRRVPTEPTEGGNSPEQEQVRQRREELCR